MGRVVVDSPTSKSICVFDRESSVLRPGSDHDGTRVEFEARLEDNLVRLTTCVDVDYRLSYHDLRAEFLGLRYRSVRELLSRKPCWKTQIVFDLGT